MCALLCSVVHIVVWCFIPRLTSRHMTQMHCTATYRSQGRADFHFNKLCFCFALGDVVVGFHLKLNTSWKLSWLDDMKHNRPFCIRQNRLLSLMLFLLWGCLHERNSLFCMTLTCFEHLQVVLFVLGIPEFKASVCMAYHQRMERIGALDQVLFYKLLNSEGGNYEVKGNQLF